MYSEQPSDTKADDKAEAKAEPSESEKKTAELETTVKDLTVRLPHPSHSSH
jgi:hypothetical protein